MKNKILNKYRETQNDTSWAAYEVTCHILQQSGINMVKAAGSGVLIKVDKLHFLVTAAHVAEDLNDNLFLGIEEYTTYRLGGIRVTNNPLHSREKDKLDVCILKLCEDTVKEVKKAYKFLDSSELGINHKFMPYPMYEFVGFPATKSKFDKYRKRLKSVPYHYITMPAEEDVYNKMGCHTGFNVVVKYDKKKVYNHSKNETQIGPELYGISGCGLWFTPPENIITKAEPKKELVGIMTEWPMNHRKYLIATRIDVISEIIRQRFNCDIPKSQMLKLNIEK